MLGKPKEMHESNPLLQGLVGKTVALVEYVDDYDEGITLHFTDGSMLCVTERMQAGQLEIGASINEETNKC
jgi:hypothetical protein